MTTAMHVHSLCVREKERERAGEFRLYSMDIVRGVGTDGHSLQCFLVQVSLGNDDEEKDTTFGENVVC